MPLNKLSLRPDQTGYAVEFPTGLLSVQLDGGAPRERLDIVGNVITMAVTWTGDPGVYAYMRQAHRYCEEQGGAHFLIDLILEDGLVTEYEAKFVPGTFKLDEVVGLKYTMSAHLQVMPQTGLDNSWPDDSLYQAALLGEDGGHLLL